MEGEKGEVVAGSLAETPSELGKGIFRSQVRSLVGEVEPNEAMSMIYFANTLK